MAHAKAPTSCIMPPPTTYTMFVFVVLTLSINSENLMAEWIVLLASDASISKVGMFERKSLNQRLRMCRSINRIDVSSALITAWI